MTAAVSAAGPGARIDRLAAAAPVVIVGYFALAALLRTLTPGGLGLDEAQIMLHAQRLEWGYGLQPPLYAWLQWAAFGVLGESKAALALVKNAVLAAALLGVWAMARLAGGSPRLAFAAALTLLLVPGIAWEAQRALTHTPLALACAALALAAFARARARPHPWGDVLVGLALGAGLLAKWNLVFVALGVVAAMLARPPRRPRGAAVVVAVALVVSAPTGLWYLADWAEAERAAGALDLAAAGGLAVVPRALAAFAEGVVATLGLAAVVLGLLLWRRPAQPAPAGVDAAVRADLTVAVTVATAAVLVASVVAGTTAVKERWLTPILFAAPPLALLWAPARLTAARAARLAGIAGAIAVAVSAGLQWNWRLGDGEPPPQTAPFAPLAAEVAAAGTAVLAADDWIGGNLRLHAPELAVVTPATATLGVALDHPVQLVWRGPEGGAPPAALTALYRARFGATPTLTPAPPLGAPFPPPHADAGPFVLRRALAE